MILSKINYMKRKEKARMRERERERYIRRVWWLELWGIGGNEWVSERTKKRKWRKHTRAHTHTHTIIQRCAWTQCRSAIRLCAKRVIVMCINVNGIFGGWMWNCWLSSWQSNSMLHSQQLRRNILGDIFSSLYQRQPKSWLYEWDIEVKMNTNKKRNWGKN